MNVTLTIRGNITVNVNDVRRLLAEIDAMLYSISDLKMVNLGRVDVTSVTMETISLHTITSNN